MKKIIVFLTAFSLLLLCSCSEKTDTDISETILSSDLLTETSSTSIFSTPEDDNTIVSETTAIEYKYEVLTDPDIRNLKWGMSLEEVKVFETSPISNEDTVEAGYDDYGNYHNKYTMLTYNDVSFGDEIIDKYVIDMSLCCYEKDGLVTVTFSVKDNKPLIDDGTFFSQYYSSDNEALDAYADFANYFKNIYGESNGEYDADYDGYNSKSWNDISDKYDILLMYSDLSSIDLGQQTNVYFFTKSEINNDPSQNTETTTTTSKQSNSSLGEQNALKRAKEYLNYSSFSYDGLVEQLEFEGYTHSEAVYAADNCGANWNSQASDKAKEYLKYSAFSYSGLVEQLEFEGYSHSDAIDAVNNCGADWNEQAAKKAKQYLEYSSFSRTGLIEQLEFEGFTHSQAVYGAEQNGY